MIAISQKNYNLLKKKGSAGDSFNDVLNFILQGLDGNRSKADYRNNNKNGALPGIDVPHGSTAGYQANDRIE